MKIVGKSKEVGPKLGLKCVINAKKGLTVK